MTLLMKGRFMTKKLTFKLAAVVIAATTISFASTASAHDNGYYHQHQNSNTGNQLLGAVIGGVAGAALGDAIAPRGQSDEFGIAGGLIGGTLGASLAGSGNYGRRGYNQGYYNGGYNGGYYQRPVYNYGHQGYYNTGYKRPYYGYSYPRTFVSTSSFSYGSPYYGYSGFNNYYRAPRTGLTINIGNGGYYNRGRGFRNRGYKRRIRNNRRFRHYRRH